MLTKDDSKSGRMSEETKLKIKISNTGREKSSEECEAISKRMSGKKLSNETKQKIREARFGKKASKETRKKMSNALKNALTKNNWNKGKIRTQEFKDNLSKQKKGKLKSVETRRRMSENSGVKIIQYDKKMNKLNIYDSVSKAANANNVLQTSISNNLTEVSKSAGGFIWKFLPDQLLTS